ncbi:MAG: hypothetical protein JJT75_09010 [Opitutales bacterium]|nr:hypothetical protein [Opitutales bacterium]MCH8539243.1 hypothetical protein [Opitutales bacterium]
MEYQDIPSEPVSLAVAVIGIGAIIGMISTFVFYPLIDRWIRNKYRMGRGEAMMLLLACSLFVATIAGTITYWQLHDDPRFQSPEEEPAVPANPE